MNHLSKIIDFYNQFIITHNYHLIILILIQIMKLCQENVKLKMMEAKFFD